MKVFQRNNFILFCDCYDICPPFLSHSQNPPLCSERTWLIVAFIATSTLHRFYGPSHKHNQNTIKILVIKQKSNMKNEQWTFALLDFAVIAAAAVQCSLYIQIPSVVQFVWFMHKSILFHMVLLSYVLIRRNKVGHEKISIASELLFTYNLVFCSHC